MICLYAGTLNVRKKWDQKKNSKIVDILLADLLVNAFLKRKTGARFQQKRTSVAEMISVAANNSDAPNH